MKAVLIWMLALITALFPVSAGAEASGDAQQAEAEVLLATVVRREEGALLVRIDQLGADEDATYPWDEAEDDGDADDGEAEDEEGAQEPPQRKGARKASSEAEIGQYTLLIVEEDTPVWTRGEDGFERAALEDIQEGDLVSALVLDGTALGIVLESASDADASPAQGDGMPA